jgi:hypothetical protein
MPTLGQVGSSGSAGGGASPTACDFEPKICPNLSPNDGLLDEDEADEEPNMLPPPHPASAVLSSRANKIFARGLRNS